MTTQADQLGAGSPAQGIDLEGLMERKVVIKGTTFTISPLLAMEGFEVLEEIREVAVSPQNLQSVIENPTPERVLKALLVVLAGLPKHVVKSVQRQMFTAVSFTNGNAQTARTLQGSEPMAFNGLSPFDVYDITVRCLAVNFLESSLDFLSRLSLPDQTTDS